MFFFADGSCCRLVSLTVFIFLVVIVILSITAPIAAPLQQRRASLDQCHDAGPSSVAKVTQSGVYTIVGTFSEHNLTCFESFANVNLEPHDTTKANGPDGISATMLKATASSIASSVAFLFNRSIQLGALPSGVGSNRVLQGPPIQVVGVALITEFCDHNYSFVEVIF